MGQGGEEGEPADADGSGVGWGHRLLAFIKNNPNGFTVSLDGETVPSKGFAVAPCKDLEIVVKFSDLNLACVSRLGTNVSKLLRRGFASDNIFAGGWFCSDDLNYYLDAVLVLPTRTHALCQALVSSQLAIFDLEQQEEINTTAGLGMVAKPESDDDCTTCLLGSDGSAEDDGGTLPSATVQAGEVQHCQANRVGKVPQRPSGDETRATCLDEFEAFSHHRAFARPWLGAQASSFCRATVG